MSIVISMKDRRFAGPDNLITSRPWEFRRSHWESRHFTQILRTHSLSLERYHNALKDKKNVIVVEPLPPHTVLCGGLAYTVRAAFGSRENEAKMREIYYLAGLVDCMINQVNPLLRTALFKQLYEKVMTMRGMLDINWYGVLDQVLLPLDGRVFDQKDYMKKLSSAGSMKALYRTIREGTNVMFDILARDYVFYVPGKGEGGHGREIP
ncbi:MAG: hypothetical protein ACOWYE_12790 [Desulfatiglandales bacterium]